MTLGRLALGVALPALLLGCGGAEAPALASATIDTLVNGVVRVTSAQPTAWSDTSGWRLVELYRVGGSEALNEAALINPQSVALGPEGTLFVADLRPSAVKQYDAAGRFVRAFGRGGSGPGEFQSAFLAANGNHLVLHDPRESRTSVFDSAGRFVKGWHSACCYFVPLATDRQGYTLIPSPPGGRGPFRMVYLRYTVDGTPGDSLWVPRSAESATWSIAGGTGANRMEMLMGVPLTPEGLSAPLPDGGLVLGWSGSYRLALSPNGRDTTRIIERTAQPAPVTGERRRQIVDSMVGELSQQFPVEAAREAVKESDLPSTAPYFKGLAVDGAGRFWVDLDDGGTPAGRRFDVFSAEGAWLGAVPKPAVFGSHYRTVWGPGDRVATITETADGLPVVIVYRIDTTLRSGSTR